jgi:lipopolysaccharide transport system ATP-binding protein
MAAIEALCTRCLVLERGRVEFDGSPTTAISRYLALLSPSSDQREPGDIDLTEMGNRHKSERPLLLRLRLSNPTLRAAGTLRMGERLSLSVVVSGLHEMPGAIVGFQLRNDLDHLLATFHTRMKPPREVSPAGPCEEYSFDLAPLPLAPGRYWISVGVNDPNRGGRVDHVGRAASFEIVPADVHRSGYELDGREGAFFVDFEWCARPLDGIAD